MPKMKSVRGASKRFKVGKNKIKRGSAFRSHILTKKSPKCKRSARQEHFVHKADEKAVRGMLCK
ncbi:50S ribosomal protein L35 [Campylobacter ureolyticus]|uniref:Large ribosomal subunit protein bL35 n=1 Tax=Campylobacter ureolyticus TaxID=827 RepID=A0A9Q4KNP1_9BACT|nr:50S ribosomal protein L35 [Campylobacter ureolyticus]MCZ6135148.1 50S ribosomal protein L35 [Campylobacter ureolyticus]MCZ6160760.1 50S ribosomal protein L35 [Campylobacter ureolyticus]MCZ6169737.1 50S ribosomal protein L35 [Campylobacter ureolyticus]